MNDRVDAIVNARLQGKEGLYRLGHRRRPVCRDHPPARDGFPATTGRWTPPAIWWRHRSWSPIFIWMPR